MAIIIKGSSECSICGNILLENDHIIGWSAFLPKEHKLWKHSDSGMHWKCYEEWEHKDEFNHLCKYQPMVSFDDPSIINQINDFGLPDWLKEIKEYRDNNKKDKQD